MYLIFTRNFTKGYNRCMRYLNDIIGHRKEFEIKRRLKIINFFDKYVLAATREAFEVSRATIYLWKKRLKESDGRLSSLASKSRIPRNKRELLSNVVFCSYAACLTPSINFTPFNTSSINLYPYNLCHFFSAA